MNVVERRIGICILGMVALLQLPSSEPRAQGLAERLQGRAADPASTGLPALMLSRSALVQE